MTMPATFSMCSSETWSVKSIDMLTGRKSPPPFFHRTRTAGLVPRQAPIRTYDQVGRYSQCLTNSKSLISPWNGEAEDGLGACAPANRAPRCEDEAMGVPLPDTTLLEHFSRCSSRRPTDLQYRKPLTELRLNEQITRVSSRSEGGLVAP